MDKALNRPRFKQAGTLSKFTASARVGAAADSRKCKLEFTLKETWTSPDRHTYPERVRLVVNHDINNTVYMSSSDILQLHQLLDQFVRSDEFTAFQLREAVAT